jgi:hypothetical protein
MSTERRKGRQVGLGTGPIFGCGAAVRPMGSVRTHTGDRSHGLIFGDGPDRLSWVPASPKVQISIGAFKASKNQRVQKTVHDDEGYLQDELRPIIPYPTGRIFREGAFNQRPPCWRLGPIFCDVPGSPILGFPHLSQIGTRPELLWLLSVPRPSNI